jgi:heptosyltransferase-2
MPEASRIVLVVPNWLGDAVMALPAIQDVRRHFAGAHVIAAARPAVAGLFGLVPAVDEVLTLQWRGHALKRGAAAVDSAALRAAAADTAILFTNSFATAWLMRRAGIGERWGYSADFRSPLLTRAVRRPSGTVHQGAYYQQLTTSLGIGAGPLEPELAVEPSAREEARALLRQHGWNRTQRLTVIAPGAAYGTAKRWLPSHFAMLIAQLARERGAHCALVGSAADADTVASILAALAPDVRNQTINLVGRTTLPMLVAVLAVADACVSNDSGAMHLAAAVGTPVAALFGPTRDRETAPLTRSGGRAEVLINPVWCRPCMLRECPIDHRCMRGLQPARVTASVAALMERAL